MVGLIPLFAVETIDAEVVEALPGFRKRFEWFINNRPNLTQNIACITCSTPTTRSLVQLAFNSQIFQTFSGCRKRKQHELAICQTLLK